MGLWVPRARGVDLGAWCPAGRAPQVPLAVTTRCQVRSSTVLVQLLAGAFPLRCEVFHVQFRFFMSYQVTRGGDRFASLFGDVAAAARAFNAVHACGSLLSVT